jgi:hypothetical protein
MFWQTTLFGMSQSPFAGGLQSCTGGQLLSFVKSHPAGQQPSLFMHEVILVLTQAALQLFGLEHESVVHALPSLHTGSFDEAQAGVMHVFEQHC